MDEKNISVIDLAEELGKAKQTVFKVLKRLGIESRKIRGPDNRGQLIAYISNIDAGLVKAEIQALQVPSSVELKMRHQN